MLLTVDDWERLVSRPVPERSGRPIVGVDLGGGRAWSAATAVWKSGRVEALAVAPGIPDLEAQEKRDRAPAGAYRKLAESGRLQVAEGTTGTAAICPVGVHNGPMGATGPGGLRPIPVGRTSRRGGFRGELGAEGIPLV